MIGKDDNIRIEWSRRSVLNEGRQKLHAKHGGSAKSIFAGRIANGTEAVRQR